MQVPLGTKARKTVLTSARASEGPCAPPLQDPHPRWRSPRLNLACFPSSSLFFFLVPRPLTSLLSALSSPFPFARTDIAHALSRSSLSLPRSRSSRHHVDPLRSGRHQQVRRGSSRRYLPFLQPHLNSLQLIADSLPSLFLNRRNLGKQYALLYRTSPNVAILFSKPKWMGLAPLFNGVVVGRRFCQYDW